MLDWIADMESPSSRKRTLSPPRPVCPQCKTDIHLARPKNYLVEAVKALERVSAKVTYPAMFMVAMSTIVNACEAHGRYSIFTIFGPRDGLRIMHPILHDLTHPHQVRNLMDVKNVFQDMMTHWRLRVGLPLITPLLVLSRTTLADGIFPVLPVVFFATQGDSGEPIDFASWPPSASLAMAVLPYLRGVYNAYYERIWALKEKRWLKEIQPRNGREGEDGAAGTNGANGDDFDANNGDMGANDANFELRIDANIWEDWGAEAEPQAQQQQQQPQDFPVAPPLDAPPIADENAQPPPPPFGNPNHQGGQQAQQQRQQQQNGQPQPAAGGDRQERLLSFSTTALAEKVLGALFFPTIASASGELLKLLLPRAWTTRPPGLGGLVASSRGRTAATGLLQEKWGRSIVGGCLFVVLKDAVMLYVRWKMACQHRRRRVLDYDRSKQKSKAKK